MIDAKKPCIQIIEVCDKCVQRACGEYVKENLKLTFCRHHIREYNVALELDGWTLTLDTEAVEQLVSPQQVVYV